MSFNENTQTMNVGSHDWLEASKDMQIRSYLPSAGYAEIITGPATQDIEQTTTACGIPVPMSVRHENVRLTERLNEAYRDDELEPEEREFLELTREHFTRLDDR